MAGLWERWIKAPAHGEFDFNDLDEPPPSRVIETFTIITTKANPLVASVHERMPVILYQDAWHQWIDDRRNGREVTYLLRPFHAEDTDCYRVSPLVNNARNDSPECLKPV
jgi:putative SOS response-associated peptidase YedK